MSADTTGVQPQALISVSDRLASTPQVLLLLGTTTVIDRAVSANTIIIHDPPRPATQHKFLSTGIVRQEELVVQDEERGKRRNGRRTSWWSVIGWWSVEGADRAIHGEATARDEERVRSQSRQRRGRIGSQVSLAFGSSSFPCSFSRHPLPLPAFESFVTRRRQ